MPVPDGAGLPVAYELDGWNEFLLASRAGGFWRLANGHTQKWRTNHMERDFGPFPWTNSIHVRAACEDLEGNLIVGTYGAGVYWYDAEGKATQIPGLNHSFILSLLLDREGCLWVGTDGGGLNRVKRQVFDVLEESQGLTVQTACADREGGLWIGYNSERVDHW